MSRLTTSFSARTDSRDRNSSSPTGCISTPRATSCWPNACVHFCRNKSSRAALRIITGNPFSRAGVRPDLFGILAAADDGGHERVLQAPRHRPVRHRDAGRHLLFLQALDFGKVALHFFRVEIGAHIVGRERHALLVFAREQAAGERHAGKWSEGNLWG